MAEDTNINSDQNPESSGLTRRDAIKGLATIPVVGGILYGAYRKIKYDKIKRGDILSEIGIKPDKQSPLKKAVADRSKQIRLGIIGFGIRGEQLARAAGYASEEWINIMKERGNTTALEMMADQDDLNVVFNGVSDIFDVEMEAAHKTVTAKGHDAKKYHKWEDLIAADDIDAVIIATPDHWHAPMAIAAARAGKHVYVEKPMTHKMQETYDLYDSVKKTGIKLQLGHQFRQTESHNQAKDLIKKGVLGPVTMVQTNTNRNSPNGAWQYPIHEKANPETIDWERFLGNAPNIPFNKDHFFRWRKYWAYGTGLSGDLLTHDFDAMNQVLELGIPKSVTASGGIYFFKDGREVPDVFNVLFEYPERDLTFQYSATLANEFNRPSIIMGHDATMEVGNTLVVYPDRRSTRYKDKIKDGTIDVSLPLFSYSPGSGVDAITSATERYFAEKGYLYTFRNGRRVDATHLHIAEWLDCIRTGGEPSCNIDQGFIEAIAAHMGTLSLHLGRRVEWDHQNNFFANVTEEEVLEVLKG